MFGLLKKKLNTFKDSLKGKLEEKKPLENELLIQKEEQKIENKNSSNKEIKEKKVFEEIKKEINTQRAEELKETVEENKTLEELSDSAEDFENSFEEEMQNTKINSSLNDEKKQDIIIKKVDEDKRELKSTVSATGKIKGLFSGKIEIKEKDVDELIWELELSLLESDVEQDTATEITNQIKKKIIGQKISLKNIDEFLKEQIKEILTEMMTTNKIDILEEIKKSKKPYVIMVLGPNGAGKTTQIAKLTHYFKKNGLTCIWAAGDTFRSGAIDQIQEHANNLDVKLIKQQYGADPAAVAFDAIKSGQANKIDVVLIDTAGRQETNKNLMEELAKIKRVIQPNLKIYVGEAYTGQGLLEMAKEFDEIIGIDGFILTKIDADAKGGTTISLLYKIKKPILFVGTGQEYGDLAEFSPEFIINRII